MRLRNLEKESIIKAVKSFDPDSRIYLFGSRVDDNRKGGDIDLLIITDKISLDAKLAIKRMIFQEVEEQKIDIILSRTGKEPFVRMIFEQGTELL
ncbi:MAG: nucleotidyltransferase domain-containing protein [Proteobacteria bacterium]|nr:nucleotidyltransferase domain-containing protein [Pseudomonadota bacterium]